MLVGIRMLLSVAFIPTSVLYTLYLFSPPSSLLLVGTPFFSLYLGVSLTALTEETSSIQMLIQILFSLVLLQEPAHGLRLRIASLFAAKCIFAVSLCFTVAQR